MANRVVAFWAVLALAIFALIAPYALAATVDNSRQHIDVHNESFTPTSGVVTLNDSNIDRYTYDDSVTVYNDTGERYEATGNYSWNATNGTLNVTAGSTLANSADASITYGYTGQTERQHRVTELLVDTNVIWVLVPLISGVGLIIAMLLALRGLA